MRNQIVGNALGLFGAGVGGFLGHTLFLWIAEQGFYGLMIPGALLGFGCSVLSPQPSRIRGLACALAAVILGLYSEWKFAPFKADESFGYLVAHAKDLKPLTLLMIALGAVFGYWLGKDASPWFGGGHHVPEVGHVLESRVIGRRRGLFLRGGVSIEFR